MCGKGCLQTQTAAALESIHAKVLAATRTQPANVDETGWTQGRSKAWLWVAVTATATAFVIRLTRSRAAFHDLAGPNPPVLTTDRYAVCDHLPGGRRQVCWAHLRRDFPAMIDRANGGSEVGTDFLLHADILFDQWERVRDGTLTRRGFRRTCERWLRVEVRSLLASGAASSCLKTAGTCREILGVEPSLWTFARVDGVELTNNAAERAVRHAVCWRKTSDGTDSETGSRFVERVLTVVATCRQKNRNVLTFLVDAVHAARTGAVAPSLVPAGV